MKLANILLDTNVLIAAFASRGTCAELLEYCARRYDLVTSEHILRELRRSLTNKLGIPPRQAREAAALLQDRMVVVEPAAVPDDACRDPEDLIVLGTAGSGQCRCLVTGDRDLLDLGRYGSIDIIPPGPFWRYEAGKAE